MAPRRKGGGSCLEGGKVLNDRAPFTDEAGLKRRRRLSPRPSCDDREIRHHNGSVRGEFIDQALASFAIGTLEPNMAKARTENLAEGARG
jgi:hypothetical protein